MRKVKAKAKANIETTLVKIPKEYEKYLGTIVIQGAIWETNGHYYALDIYIPCDGKWHEIPTKYLQDVMNTCDRIKEVNDNGVRY